MLKVHGQPADGKQFLQDDLKAERFLTDAGDLVRDLQHLVDVVLCEVSYIFGGGGVGRDKHLRLQGLRHFQRVQIGGGIIDTQTALCDFNSNLDQFFIVPPAIEGFAGECTIYPRMLSKSCSANSVLMISYAILRSQLFE